MEPASASYILAAAQFEREITQHGGDIAWRRAQVDRVVASFEESKGYMLRDGVGEVHNYLTSAKWIQHCTNVGQHPVYKRFVGTDGHGLKSLYYPHFFVIQAVFVLNGRETGSAIERMYQELSRHWLMDITPDVTFYPRLADPERERQLILGNIPGAHVRRERQSTSGDKHKGDKHKELSVHLEAAAKLSAEIQDEDEVKQQRAIDFQRMRDELRLAKQRNLDLERQVQEQSNLQQNAENKLKENEAQLHNIQRQLIASRKYTNALKNDLSYMQNYISQSQQLSIEIQEMDKQRKVKSSMHQQCMNKLAERSFSRHGGFNPATKRPADSIAEGEESKRPRQE